MIELRDKVSFAKLEELKDTVHNLQTINVSMEESLSQKLTVLKDDFESKTKEMMDNIEDLNKKMDELSEEDGSYDDEGEGGSDSDMGSELGDTLDVNDMNRTVMDKDKETPDQSPKNKDGHNSSYPVPKTANSDPEHDVSGGDDDDEFSKSGALSKENHDVEKVTSLTQPLTALIMPTTKLTGLPRDGERSPGGTRKNADSRNIKNGQFTSHTKDEEDSSPVRVRKD